MKQEDNINFLYAIINLIDSIFCFIQFGYYDILQNKFKKKKNLNTNSHWKILAEESTITFLLVAQNLQSVADGGNI